MSKKDRLQNRYNTLNIYLGIALTSFLAIIGFIVTSMINKAPMWVFVLSAVAFVVVSGAIVFIQISLNAINDDIERM